MKAADRADWLRVSLAVTRGKLHVSVCLPIHYETWLKQEERDDTIQLSAVRVHLVTIACSALCFCSIHLNSTSFAVASRVLVVVLIERLG